VLLPLVLARLIYRLTHPPLPLPADIHPLQQSAAYTTHWTLCSAPPPIAQDGSIQFLANQMLDLEHVPPELNLRGFPWGD
jgi:hypothetical protein